MSTSPPRSAPRPSEVVLTGGGTEADNLAVKGAARAARDAGTGDGVVTTAFEHKGVLAACDRLERDGFRVQRVGVDRRGLVDLDALAAALDARTVVVSVMLVNNEVGTIQPLDEIAELGARRARRGARCTPTRCRPCRGSTSRRVPRPRISSRSPRTSSAGRRAPARSWCADGAALEPLVEGGGQERGLRSGTVNVAGAVADGRGAAT